MCCISGAALVGLFELALLRMLPLPSLLPLLLPFLLLLPSLLPLLKYHELWGNDRTNLRPSIEKSCQLTTLQVGQISAPTVSYTGEGVGEISCKSMECEKCS